jgi:phage repressor protein C with HTH and peptisase S24 domain
MCDNYSMKPGKKVALARKYQMPALTQKNLAELLGIDTSSVGRWEYSGDIPAFRLPAVASALGVSTEWLTNGDSLPPNLTELSTVNEVGVFDLPSETASFVRGDEVLLPTWRGTMASDGECEFYPSESTEFMAIPAFLASSDPEGHILCIASGASMFPRVQNGERVVVRLDRNPPNNTIIVSKRPDGANFVKILRQNVRGFLELHSLNAEFAPIITLDGWEMRGYAVAIIHSYEPGRPNIEWDHGRALRA